MKLMTAVLALAMTGVPMLALAAAEIGKAAPAFSVLDATGKVRTLEEFKGKTVVLEWNNPECPFVKKHYVGSSNMQNQQKAATEQGETESVTYETYDRRFGPRFGPGFSPFGPRFGGGGEGEKANVTKLVSRITIREKGNVLWEAKQIVGAPQHITQKETHTTSYT